MKTAAPALLALAIMACGSEERHSDPFTAVRDRTAERTDRASPRWEPVTTLAGSGPARKAFTVADGAIQWRARYRCETGDLRLSADGRSLARASCPGAGTASDVRTGTVTLGVEATGAWRVAVDQQVDTPLREPPLPGMGDDVLARGDFYGIERRGAGTASLHRLRSDRLALRLDGFSTSANSDLFVWLSTARRPRTTVQAARAPHTVLRELKSTLGSQNYLLPADVEAADVRSVVIWCVPIRIAYTAATLRPR